MRNSIYGALLSGLFSLGIAGSALSCAFHGYTPNPTLVDLLLATEQAIIAEPDPADPSQYKLVEVLMGPEVAEIPIPVSAATRKALSARSSARVLLARDGAYGPWMELTVLEHRLQSVLVQVAKRQAALLNGGDKDRLALFAKLLNDPSPDVRRLSLQELDRAPYSTLRNMRLPNIQNLKRDLETRDEDLMPIRILLAGLSQDQSFSRYLSQELETAVQSDTPYMGAYATALIELDGPTAVQTILEHYLSDRAQPLERRIKILEVMSIQHKAAPRKARREIARGVASILRQSPDLKEPAASLFGLRVR